MISVYDKKEDCCGCTACKNICPVEAIKMMADKEGFLYPNINQELCVDCGICRKVCPLQNKVVIQDRFCKPFVYAIQQKDNQIRMESASGGAYTAISDYGLDLSSAIYGVKFDEKFNVIHSKALTVASRDEFRGSKYVQSNLNDTFKQIQNNLTDGQSVLFSGTGCQVAGLRKFLDGTKTDISNLITNDIICHGVPSPLLWADYLKVVQIKEDLESYTFRYKKKGWRGYNVKVKYKTGNIKVNTPAIRIYATIFASDLALRPSCYKCQFTNIKRTSDITIGDFWGIEKTRPEIDDNKGLSLILVNTPKGKYIFDKIKGKLDVWESNTDDCLQPNLQHPTKMPEKRELFWQEYYKYGFNFIARKYGGYNLKTKLKYVIKKILEKLGIL